MNSQNLITSYGLSPAAKLVFLIFLSLTICGCNKTHKVVNPQMPGAYFPAYPGSWWEYNKNDNSIFRYTISEEYELCHEKFRPVLTNNDRCIQGNSLMYPFYAGLGQMAEVRSSIYSLNTDSSFYCAISFCTLNEMSQQPYLEVIPYRRRTIKKDTSLILPNGIIYFDVIIVEETNVFDINHKYYDYFARDIGLIKREKVNASDSTQLTTLMTLEACFIGKTD